MPLNLYDVPLFGMLRTKLSWLSDRQQVLAQNISNSSTPGYQARDLKQLSFKQLLDRGEALGGSGSHAETKRVHISRGQARFKIEVSDNAETTPNGNSVSLEDQLMRSGETQVDYQSAIDIYKKGLSLLRMAVSSPR